MRLGFTCGDQDSGAFVRGKIVARLAITGVELDPHQRVHREVVGIILEAVVEQSIQRLQVVCNRGPCQAVFVNQKVSVIAAILEGDLPHIINRLRVVRAQPSGELATLRDLVLDALLGGIRKLRPLVDNRLEANGWPSGFGL